MAFRFGFLRVIGMEPNVEALWSDGLSEAEMSRCHTEV